MHGSQVIYWRTDPHYLASYRVVRGVQAMVCDVCGHEGARIRRVTRSYGKGATIHEERLRDERLTEDEVADLTNDYQYLEAIKIDLKKYHGELLHKLSSHAQRS